MDTKLEEFIESHASMPVWYATPAGLFQGIRSTFYSASDPIITLDEGYYISGNLLLKVGKTNIIKKEIIAWGERNPVVQYKLE